jgi:hypothetical protein
MLETLKFVRAAVCRNDLQPTLQHFRIVNRTVTATNGQLTIQAPLPVDLDCAPQAMQFFKAIAACEGTIALTLDKGRLLVRSGRFKSTVDCADADRFPVNQPTGQTFPLSAPIVPVLKRLLPFVSTDELRPWACGVLFVNNSAFATNNISIIEHWLPVAFPVIAHLPTDAIKELIRLKIEPHSVQVESHQVTFHLPGGAWIACQTTVHKWPDLQRIFTEAETFKGPWTQGADLEALLNDVEKLAPFTDEMNRVRFHPGEVSTSRPDAPGTSLALPASPGAGVFQAGQILGLRGVASKVGFANYPRPVPFYGEGVRGVIGGMIDPGPVAPYVPPPPLPPKTPEEQRTWDELVASGEIPF